MSEEYIAVDGTLLVEPSSVPPATITVGDAAEVDAVWDAEGDPCLGFVEWLGFVFGGFIGVGDAAEVDAVWDAEGDPCLTFHQATCDQNGDETMKA
jgi:hypothetical protein